MDVVKKWLLVALVALPQLAWAGFDEGLAAYNCGDYATVLKEWRPLAEQGDAGVQVYLGYVYENSDGVPKDAVEAVKWYRLAAEQGHAKAQFSLGVMYKNGEGVPQDIVAAYAWSNIAAAHDSRVKRRQHANVATMTTGAGFV